MSERRMIAKTVVDTDKFLDMPLSTQALYFHLNLQADDDGVVGSPKKIRTIIGATEEDLRLLIEKGFLISFDTGVIVIKHWKVNNLIRKDRYKQSFFQTELSQLREDKGVYSFISRDTPRDPLSTANGIPNSDQGLTQDSIGKDSIDKVSIDKDREDKDTVTPSSSLSNNSEHKYGEYKNVRLSLEDIQKLKTEFPDWRDRVEALSTYIAAKGDKYKNHLAVIRAWAKRENQHPQKITPPKNNNFTDYSCQREYTEDELEKLLRKKE
ncbi:MAG: replisome organizer [Firmicutes bacterium]|nr:replisome organizer [Bacillota bacterium]